MRSPFRAFRQLMGELGTMGDGSLFCLGEIDGALCACGGPHAADLVDERPLTATA